MPSVAANGGGRRSAPSAAISIAAPEASDELPAGGPSWLEISKIIAADMTASGRFLPIEPGTPIVENVAAVPQFDRWRGIDTEVLVTGPITPASNGRLKVEFRLWDMASGQLLVARQYGFGPEGPREIPHVIAAAIMERFGR